MVDANSLIEVNVRLITGSDSLHGSLQLGRGKPRQFRGWPELADMILEASEPEGQGPGASPACVMAPLELALSSGSPSTVTLRCYVADPAEPCLSAAGYPRVAPA